MAAQNLTMAKLAERAERYEDMSEYMKMFVLEKGDKLSAEERNLLSVAYKSVISKTRSSLRSLAAMEAESDDNLIKSYKPKVEDELKKYCMELINLLDENLIIDSLDVEEAVFYHKMKADYFRYLAEFVDKAENSAKSEAAYMKAIEKAEESMPAPNPIRLGVALNYSVFLFEMQAKEAEAVKVAREAFDNAINELESVNDEQEYKDATLVMQLLRDNLTLWTNEDDDVEVLS